MKPPPVKGFDAVHIVESEGSIELWLGEVKYYQDIQQAIRDVSVELALHLEADYLRGEFMAVSNKVDPEWPYVDQLNQLIDRNTSLDQIFNAVTVPVLLTYDSAAVLANTCLCNKYIEELTDEAEAAWRSFAGRISTSWRVRLRLILMPLKSKESITSKMHERLRLWQRI